MWWPAIGGLAVGVIGYFAPHTLGVGYDNITGILSGKWPLTLICTLCLFKFLSWAIALGSGTSGGTLAPLLTIGGAAGAIIGTLIQAWFPQAGIIIPMAALIGISAMFAGASRAYLTSITFALEATMQSHALLPLLGACTAAYLVSFIFMENTIMTEKIARRGVFTPDSYEPDILQKINVARVINGKKTILNVCATILEVRELLKNRNVQDSYLVTTDNDNKYTGTVKLSDIYKYRENLNISLENIIQPDHLYVQSGDNLRKAVELMSEQKAEVLPVISTDDQKVIDVLSYRDIILSYKYHIQDNDQASTFISLKRKRIKMMLRNKKAKTKG